MKRYYKLKHISPKKDQYIFRIENVNKKNYFICSWVGEHLYDYISDIRDNHNIHEVIHSKERKLLFDIEYYYGEEIGGEIVMLNPWIMLEDIISNVIEIVKEYYEIDIKVEDFLIFQSNGRVEKDNKSLQKYSHHIVLNNYYFEHRLETEFICSKVKEKFPEYSIFLDNVYSKNQCIRILHSTKIGTERTKRFVDKYVFGDGSQTQESAKDTSLANTS